MRLPLEMARKDRQPGQIRQGLWLFAGLLLLYSLLGYWFYSMNRESRLPILPSLPLMLSPALAATITRLVFREGFNDVSFQSGGRRTQRAMVVAMITPVVVGCVAYGSAYLLGLVQFVPPMQIAPALSPLAATLLLISLNGTLGTLVLLPSSAGEEIGWRGYLLPRLIQIGTPCPLLLTGLIWGAWHLIPLWLVGYAAGPYPLLATINLLLATLTFGTILAWLRLDTGSIWPSIVAHAAWNAMINGGFAAITTGAAATLWLGESGILVVLALVGVMLLVGTIGRQWITGSLTISFSKYKENHHV